MNLGQLIHKTGFVQTGIVGTVSNAILVVKVPNSKNELTHVHVGQKHPFTQKIRSLAQKPAILVF